MAHIVEQIAVDLALTAMEREELLPSGRQRASQSHPLGQVIHEHGRADRFACARPFSGDRKGQGIASNKARAH
nr:winged helix-turn-helix domain-containing protein [Methylobacterium terricola]